MLRDFGIVTVVDLGVALLGVMIVLPATLVWAEGGFEPFPRIGAGAAASRSAAACPAGRGTMSAGAWILTRGPGRVYSPSSGRLSSP